MTSSFCLNMLTKTQTIIAGQGPTERYFVVPKHCLCLSPVIKGWIEDHKTIPSKMWKDAEKALCFPNCEPEVMDLVIRYLKEEDGNDDYKIPPTDENAMFYAKIYKLAICFGLEYLSLEALRNLRTRIRNIEDFAELASFLHGLDLVDEEKFRQWFYSYIAEHLEQFLESEHLRTAIYNGGHFTWNFCAVLMSALSHAKEDCRSRETSKPVMTPLTPPSSSPYKY